MIIVVKMKNLIQRGKNYYFRLTVPQDCKETVGKREILLSLKTDDPLKATKEADKLTEHWKACFDNLRKSKVSNKPLAPIKRVTTPSLMLDYTLDAFSNKLISHLEKNLPALLDKNTDKELQELSRHYRDMILMFKDGFSMLDAGRMHLDLPELGLTGLWKPAGSPGVERRRRRAVAEVLKTAQGMIDVELGIDYSKRKNATALPETSGQKVPAKAPARIQAAVADRDFNIFDITDLMLNSKKRIPKTQITIRADVKNLSEWCGGCIDIRDFDKRALIDFVKECLPYIPKHAAKKKCYNGVSLLEQTKMVKGNPDKYVPISETTCKNRLTALSSVFNFAIKQLGVIPINPVTGLEVQAIRSIPNRNRAFSQSELIDFHMGIQTVRSNSTETSGCFWIPMLSLYHGFRLNEICSLFVKDVYKTDDGIWVIDVNRNDPTKRVKNDPSVRVVPIHPYLHSLGFLDYVDRQQAERSDGLLFPELTFTETAGYARNIGRWFSKWKTTWLPEDSHYKNFHGLRYTFIQTAQNEAGMSDRCNQEITGHDLPGVSSVHLGYSGRLKPAAVLEELAKLRYGWE